MDTVFTLWCVLRLYIILKYRKYVLSVKGVQNHNWRITAKLPNIHLQGSYSCLIALGRVLFCFRFGSDGGFSFICSNGFESEIKGGNFVWLITFISPVFISEWETEYPYNSFIRKQETCVQHWPNIGSSPAFGGRWEGRRSFPGEK